MHNRSKSYLSSFGRLWLIASLTMTVLFLLAPGQNPPAKRPSSSKNVVQNYSMDLAQSEIKLILTQEGLLARRRPVHNVGVKNFSGKILYPPKDETKVSITLDAETSSFENIDPDMADIERRGFMDVLHNKVLEIDKYPKIMFKSASVSDVKSRGNNRSFTLSGDLTLHGTTKRVAFPVNATIDKSMLRGTGEAKLKQTDFGMTPFQGGLGTIKIADELKITFVIVAKPS